MLFFVFLEKEFLRVFVSRRTVKKMSMKTNWIFVWSALLLGVAQTDVQAATTCSGVDEASTSSNMTETRRVVVPLDAFDALDVYGNIKLLEIRLVPGQPLALEALESDLEHLEVFVAREKLFITQADYECASDGYSLWQWLKRQFCANDDRDQYQLDTLVLRAGSLEQIALAGKVELCCPDTLRGETFAYYGKGLCSARLRVVAGQTDIHLSGGSRLEVAGRSPVFHLDVGGQSHLVAWGLECRQAVVQVSGQSHADLRVSHSLRADASGQSHIAAAGIVCEYADVSASGQSQVQVQVSRELRADASGQSHIVAVGTPCERTIVSASGQSRIQVRVSQELCGDASGGSRIVYSGNPPRCQVQSSGGSSLQKN